MMCASTSIGALMLRSSRLPRELGIVNETLGATPVFVETRFESLYASLWVDLGSDLYTCESMLVVCVNCARLNSRELGPGDGEVGTARGDNWRVEYPVAKFEEVHLVSSLVAMTPRL